MKGKIIEFIGFLILSLLVTFFLYGNSFWGSSLLAPLDIGADIFTQYRFMDPNADGVPDNHYIIDQFTYDLPLQYLLYSSYNSGEIPWWDPYTYGGRPFLADAHINGTDPIRLLCYLVLPFELAYNWNLILHSILTGLGMFAMLRYLRVCAILAAILAITYQFAGWFTLHIGHPWIQAGFVYYPFLSIVWMHRPNKSFGIYTAIGSGLCALIFYAGNLQSHSYLVLYAVAFLAAVFWKSSSKIWHHFALVSVSGFIGALLASPVLLNQIEFFMNGVRSTSASGNWFDHLFRATIAMGAFYPWMFGSFRTLDIGRLIMSSGVSYVLFCGSAVFLIAAWYFWKGRKLKGYEGVAWAFSVILITLFIFILGTPLNHIFYARCAPLAGIGIIVLAGLGLQSLLGNSFENRKAAIFATTLVLLSSIASSIAAWFIYPHFQAEIENHVLQADKANASFTSAPALRKFQIANFSNEVSINNPEALLSVLATLLFLTIILSSKSKRLSSASLGIVLIINLIPVLHFHYRFKPCHDIALWHKMLKGGPAQNAAIYQANGFLRLEEQMQPLSEYVFPNSLAALYKVHVVHGYSALQPPSFHVPPKYSPNPHPEWRSDGIIGKTPTDAFNKTVRFLSGDAEGKPIPLMNIRESLNTTTLTLTPSGISELIRTDTFFPGWTAQISKNQPQLLVSWEHIFTKISIPMSSHPVEVSFAYWPRYWSLSIILFAAGILITCCLMLTYFIKSSPTSISTKSIT